MASILSMAGYSKFILNISAADLELALASGNSHRQMVFRKCNLSTMGVGWFKSLYSLLLDIYSGHTLRNRQF